MINSNINRKSNSNSKRNINRNRISKLVHI